MSLPVCHTNGHSTIRDAELVSRAQAGDREAFGALYVRHYEDVFAYIRSRGLDLTAAEDVASATWLAAWRRLGRFVIDSRPFMAWLIGVSKYEILVYLDRSRRHPTLPLEDDQVAFRDAGARRSGATGARSEHSAEAIARRPYVAGSPTEEAVVARAELADAVRMLLPGQYRRLVAALLPAPPRPTRPAEYYCRPMLREFADVAAVQRLRGLRLTAATLHLEGKTKREIAREMQTTMQAVHSLLRAARRELRGLDPVTGRPRGGMRDAA